MEGPYLNPEIEVGGIDLSQKAFSLTWGYEANAVPFGAYGDATQINKGGVKDWALNIQMNAEFSSAVDANLFSFVGSSTIVCRWRPRSTDVRGPTNPEYRGTGMLESFGPAEGDWGERSVFTMSIVSAGDLTRDPTSTST